MLKAGMIAADIAVGVLTVVGFCVVVLLMAVWLDIKSRRK